MNTLKKLSLITATAALIFSSCKKDDITEPSSSTEGSQGTMKVKMTDGPANFAGLNMEITGVDIYSAQSGWVTLSSNKQTVDVLSLNNGVSTDLTSSTSVSAGTYTRVKVHFSNNNSLLVKSETNGTVATASLQWAGPQDVEIAINKTVSANAGSEVLLDFQVAKSIAQTLTGYVIMPVITEVKNESTGANGTVKGTESAHIILTNGAHYYDTHTNANGEFLFKGVEPGVYEMAISPVKTATSTATDKRLQGFVITEGKISEAGTIVF